MKDRDNIWIHRAFSFEEAAAFDRDHYLRMTPTERLEAVQMLREEYRKLKDTPHAGGKGLRRVLAVVKRA